MELAGGRTVLFAGGAKSADWRLRTAGRGWFPEEVLLPGRLPSPMPAADAASRTLPLRFGAGRFSRRACGPSFGLAPDPSREALGLVLEGAAPKVWAAGHFHLRED